MEKQVRGRLLWLDSLKGFAIILVVLGHVLLGYIENDAFPRIHMQMTILNHWIYSWHMPLFMCVSGYSFALAYLTYYRNEDSTRISVNRDRVKRQILNLLIIYLLFSVSLCGLKIVFSMFVDNKMNLVQMIVNIMLPNTLMWYLWVLVIFYLLALFLSRKNDLKISGSPMKLCALAYVWAIIVSYIENFFEIRLCIKNFLELSFYFILGIVICKSKKKYMKNFTFKILMVVFVILYIFVEIGIRKNMNLLLFAVLENINAFAMIIIMLGLFEKIGEKTIILQKLGKESLVIYLLHTYLVTAMKRCVITVGLDGYLGSVCAILITLILPLVITYFIGKIKYKSWFVRIIFHPIELFDRKRQKGYENFIK